VNRVTLRTLIALMSVALALSCSRENDSAKSSSIEAYGFGPDPKGNARYQPDVVLIGGGPRAIRSESADGLTWVIDPSAEGARDLAVDKIMFATSRVVGRVVALEERDAGLAVTLAPVKFTDVVRDANVKLAVRFDPETISFRQIPDLLHSRVVQPAVFLEDAGPARNMTLALPVVQDAPDEMLLVTEPVRLYGSAQLIPIRAHTERGGQAPVAKGSASVSLHGFDIGLSLKGEGNKTALGLQIMRKQIPLKIGVEIKLLTRNLRVRTNLPVHGGTVDKSASFVVEGLEELHIGLQAGSENGLSDNTKIRIEVPLEAYADIPPSPETFGIPMAVMFKAKFLLTTAFSAMNSTIGASGQYGLTGPLGFEGGTLLKPEVTVISPMTKIIHGIAVGPAGLVVAFEFKYLVGIGSKVALAGPYGKFTTAIGVTMGSTLGLVQCKGMTLKVDGAVGIGTQVSAELGGVLERILGKKVSSSFDIAERSATLFERSATAPDVPLCRG
jgi:hypothetical protein